MRYFKSLILAAVLFAGLGIADDAEHRELADDAEQRKFAEEAEQRELKYQQAFREGMQDIVDGLNNGSTNRFVTAIDPEAFLEKIFGLRLIDPRVKREFGESMKNQFPQMVGATFSDSKGDIKATLLGVESRANRGRAIVRYDLPDLQFSYHEYDLLLDDDLDLEIVDWIDFLQGERFSDGMGTTLVMAAPSKAAARKLIDYKNVRESDLFQFMELLKATRDRRADRYVDIINNMSPQMQRQRVVVQTGVQLTKIIRNRRMMRTALHHMAQHFPEEPLYSLMLLDYYFPSRLYEEAYTGLQRLYDRLDVDDAAMEARLSAAALVMGNADDANAFANRALELEAGLELGWWSALRARAALEDYAGAVEALTTLTGTFGHTLGPEELKRDRSFAGLLASENYQRWIGGS
ncbi:MAG: hypothetical protein KJO82_08455 [Gammaproteobacteria bacterium]|nr:hypothetical protein [Gammaproteobacteria bacterium]